MKSSTKTVAIFSNRSSFFLFIHWIKCFVLDFNFVSVVFCVLFNRSTQKHRNVNVWKNWILLTTQFSLFKEHTCFSARSVWKKTPVLTTKEPCGTNVKINHFECVCVCVSVCMREWASCNRLMHCLCRIIFFSSLYLSLSRRSVWFILSGG